MQNSARRVKGKKSYRNFIQSILIFFSQGTKESSGSHLSGMGLDRIFPGDFMIFFLSQGDPSDDLNDRKRKRHPQSAISHIRTSVRLEQCFRGPHQFLVTYHWCIFSCIFCCSCFYRRLYRRFPMDPTTCN